MEWYAIVLKLMLLILPNVIIVKLLLKRLWTEYLQAEQLSRRGCYVEGVVIDIFAQEDIDQQTQYAPIVEYCTSEGNKVVAPSSEFKYVKPELNSKVQVCYNEANPSEMMTNPRREVQARAWLFFLWCVIPAFLDIMMIWQLLREG